VADDFDLGFMMVVVVFRKGCFRANDELDVRDSTPATVDDGTSFALFEMLGLLLVLRREEADDLSCFDLSAAFFLVAVPLFSSLHISCTGLMFFAENGATLVSCDVPFAADDDEEEDVDDGCWRSPFLLEISPKARRRLFLPLFPGVLVEFASLCVPGF